jgi:HAMP domain-containing protein
LTRSTRENNFAEYAGDVANVAAAAEAVSGIALLIGIVLGFVVARGITKPLAVLTATMNDLASGNIDAEIPGTDRKDEVGIIAKAVPAFPADGARGLKDGNIHLSPAATGWSSVAQGGSGRETGEFAVTLASDRRLALATALVGASAATAFALLHARRDTQSVPSNIKDVSEPPMRNSNCEPRPLR